MQKFKDVLSLDSGGDVSPSVMSIYNCHTLLARVHFYIYPEGLRRLVNVL